jgi:hypothetical protein
MPMELATPPARDQVDAHVERGGTCRRWSTDDDPTWPRSIRPTAVFELPAAMARSTWRQPFRRRSSLIVEPSR